MEYIAYLHKDKKSDYGVSFPDFPGCVTAGSTLEEARKMAIEALNLHIVGMLEDGDRIPPPSTLDEVKDDPAMRNAIAILVETAEPEKTIRINITMRENDLSEIDERARKCRLSRSAYMVQRSLDADQPLSQTPRANRGSVVHKAAAHTKPGSRSMKK